MDKKELNVLKNVDYANLNEKQHKKLKEFEKKFNEEFGEDYNIMVMKKETENLS